MIWANRRFAKQSTNIKYFMIQSQLLNLNTKDKKMSAFNKNAFQPFDIALKKAFDIQKICNGRIFDLRNIANYIGGGNHSPLKCYKHYSLNTQPYFLQSFFKRQNYKHKNSIAHAGVCYVA